MCAISGIVNTHGRPYGEVIRNMMRSQTHRGPDDCGCFECEDAALAHCRLSIIDIDGGHQPMHSSDNRLAVVFNGEIYNFRQWREKLIATGHKFVTQSDTEVLLRLYENYGSECVNLLDGMFAFAIFDRVRRKLVLARDRLGQKPLLYFMDGDTLVFASEFAGLLQYPEFPRELDKESLSNFMSLQYIPQPDTIYRKVRKLPPGHILELNLDNSHISIHCYWQTDFSIKNSTMTLDSATAKLRTLVEKAVEKRLVSDVPIGTFLSGGIDSCIVTGIAARMLYPAPCDAFTAVFPTLRMTKATRRHARRRSSTGAPAATSGIIAGKYSPTISRSPENWRRTSASLSPIPRRSRSICSAASPRRRSRWRSAGTARTRSSPDTSVIWRCAMRKNSTGSPEKCGRSSSAGWRGSFRPGATGAVPGG